MRKKWLKISVPGGCVNCSDTNSGKTLSEAHGEIFIYRKNSFRY